MTTSNGVSPEETITRADAQRSFGQRGLSIWGGFLNEEYLTALSPWRKQVRVYIEMSDDPTIGTALDAVKLPLLAADFDAEAASESDGDKRARDFLWDAMNGMHRQTFRSFAADQLESLEFGFAVGEIILDKREDGNLWIHNIDPRGQETLARWRMGGEHNDIPIAMEQGSFRGSLVDNTNTVVPLSKAVHAVFHGRKGNPQGRSLLRSLYRAWRFMVQLENFEGIGVERDVGGMPVVTLPDEPLTNEDDTALRKALKGLRLDEEMYMMLPRAGTGENSAVKLEAYASGSKAYDIRAIIEAKKKEILMRMFAQFLALGMSNVGTQALVQGSQDFFTLGLESVQQSLVETWNQQLVPYLFSFNTFPGMTPGQLPKIVWKQPGAVDVKSIIESYSEAVSAKLITPIRDDESVARSLMDLPDLPDNEGLEPREAPEQPPEFMRELRRMNAKIDGLVAKETM